MLKDGSHSWTEEKSASEVQESSGTLAVANVSLPRELWIGDEGQILLRAFIFWKESGTLTPGFGLTSLCVFIVQVIAADTGLGTVRPWRPEASGPRSW